MQLAVAKKSAGKQSGQTLIETVVAIFVLVVGLIAASGLAISSFQSTDLASKQIIATALARQGVEAVKNIRDSNWQNGALSDCSATMSSGQFCYSNWLGSGATALTPGTYAVKNNGGAVDPWSLSATSAYVLNYNPSSGVYDVGGTGSASIYSRKVVLSQNTAAPFNAANPEVIVDSSVWWYGRNCTQTTDPSTLPASCKVVLEMHLTNWRNY